MVRCERLPTCRAARCGDDATLKGRRGRGTLRDHPGIGTGVLIDPYKEHEESSREGVSPTPTKALHRFKQTSHVRHALGMHARWTCAYAPPERFRSAPLAIPPRRVSSPDGDSDKQCPSTLQDINWVWT